MNIIRNILGRDQWSKDDAVSDALARGAAYTKSVQAPQKEQFQPMPANGPRIPDNQKSITPTYINNTPFSFPNQSKVPTISINPQNPAYFGPIKEVKFENALKTAGHDYIIKNPQPGSIAPAVDRMQITGNALALASKDSLLRYSYPASSTEKTLYGLKEPNPNYNRSVETNTSRVYNLPFTQRTLTREQANIKYGNSMPFEQRTLSRDQANKIYGNKLMI
jgi:hypothetical protein